MRQNTTLIFPVEAIGGVPLGITLILAPIAAMLALGLGIAGGRQRGAGVGIVTGLGVLAAVAVGYVVVFSLSLRL